MPKTYGIKEKDQVVSYITEQLLTGALRTGDRIDRNRIAAELGLSRIPVSEAIIQLENDGILASRYHRGAYVLRFDPGVVLEHHEVYGLLSGLAAARAATYPTPRIIEALTEVIAVMRSTTEPRKFQEAVWEYRRTVNNEYAGPRLRAIIRASQSFMPQAVWMSYRHNNSVLLPFYEREHSAIRRRDPADARSACEQRAIAMARVVISDLVTRGVFDDDDGIESPILRTQR